MEGDPFVTVRNTKSKSNYKPKHLHSNNNYSNNSTKCSRHSCNRNTSRYHPHNFNYSARGGPLSYAQPQHNQHHYRRDQEHAGTTTSKKYQPNRNRNYNQSNKQWAHPELSSGFSQQNRWRTQKCGGTGASATVSSDSTSSYGAFSQSHNGSQSFSNFRDKSNSNWHFADSSRAFHNRHPSLACGKNLPSREFRNLNNGKSARRRSRWWANRPYSNTPFRPSNQPTTTSLLTQQQPRSRNSRFGNMPQNPGFAKIPLEQSRQQSFNTAQSNGIESWARQRMDTSEDAEDFQMHDAHQLRHTEPQKKRKAEEKAACDGMNPNAPLTYDCMTDVDVPMTPAYESYSYYRGFTDSAEKVDEDW